MDVIKPLISDALDNPTRTNRADLSLLLNVMAYHNMGELDEYNHVLSQLCRTDTDSLKKSRDEEFYLKQFELMVRCGLVPGCAFDQLSRYTRSYLLKIRATPLQSQPAERECNILSSILGLNCMHYPNVQVGPYSLHFVKLREPGVSENAALRKDPDLIRLAKECVCIEPLNRDSYIGDSTELSPNACIRQAVLDKLRIKSVRIPFYEFDQLKDDKSKSMYIASALTKID